MALGQISPGPDLLLVTRTSLAQGRAAGWWTTAGITTGLCVHASVAILGMAWLMAQGGSLATALTWGAAAYLGWLGLSLLRQSVSALRGGSASNVLSGPPSDRRSAYLRGLLCNLLNPKVALLFAAIVAEFLKGDRPLWWSGALWFIIVGQGFVVWMIYVWFLQFPPFQRGYLRAAPWIDSAFGVGLLAVAVMLLVSG